LPRFPEETAIGSLLRYLKNAESALFQPMNVNLGIFPPLDAAVTQKIPGKKKKLTKPERCQLFGERSRVEMEKFLRSITN
jgi:methylenetetrahydrofolate--tRNA-(uracil-5-)-methyltransferase